MNTVRREALKVLRIRIRTLKKDLLEGREGCFPACEAMLLGSLLKGLRGLNLLRYIDGLERDVMLEHAWDGLMAIQTPDWCAPGVPGKSHLCDMGLRLRIVVTESVQVVNSGLRALSLSD